MPEVRHEQEGGLAIGQREAVNLRIFDLADLSLQVLAPTTLDAGPSENAEVTAGRHKRLNPTHF